MEKKKPGKTRLKKTKIEVAPEQEILTFIPLEMQKIFKEKGSKASPNEQILLSLIVQIIVEITLKEEL